MAGQIAVMAKNYILHKLIEAECARNVMPASTLRGGPKRRSFDDRG
jgi:hypothetical protein